MKVTVTEKYFSILQQLRELAEEIELIGGNQELHECVVKSHEALFTTKSTAADIEWAKNLEVKK